MKPKTCGECGQRKKVDDTKFQCQKTRFLILNEVGQKQAECDYETITEGERTL